MLDKVRCEVEGLSNIKALCETNVLPENTQHIKKGKFV